MEIHSPGWRGCKRGGFMKKRFGVLFFLLFLAMQVFSVYGAEDIKVVVDDNELTFKEVKPFIDDAGYIQVPADNIGKAFNAEVKWNEKRKEYAFSKGDKKILFYIDADFYFVNGIKKQMDTFAVLDKKQVYIPVSYLTDALGAQADWDEKTLTMSIASSVNKVGDFIIPDGAKFSAVELKGDNKGVVYFSLAVYITDFKTASKALTDTMSQKISADIMTKIASFIKAHGDYKDFTAAEEEFFDESNNRHIKIERTAQRTINIYVYPK